MTYRPKHHKWIIYDIDEKKIVDKFFSANTARRFLKHYKFIRMTNLEVRVNFKFIVP